MGILFGANLNNGTTLSNGTTTPLPLENDYENNQYELNVGAVMWDLLLATRQLLITHFQI